MEYMVDHIIVRSSCAYLATKYSCINLIFKVFKHALTTFSCCVYCYIQRTLCCCLLRFLYSYLQTLDKLSMTSCVNDSSMLLLKPVSDLSYNVFRQQPIFNLLSSVLQEDRCFTLYMTRMVRELYFPLNN